MRRIIGILALMLALAIPAGAQVPVQPYRVSASSALEICQIVTPASGAPGLTLYGFHVTNTSASTVYAQVFNASAQPASTTVPLGASSWAVPAAGTLDVSIGEVQGWGGFTTGIAVCCSTTQATFTATGSVCGIVVTYQ